MTIDLNATNKSCRYHYHKSALLSNLDSLSSGIRLNARYVLDEDIKKHIIPPPNGNFSHQTIEDLPDEAVEEGYIQGAEIVPISTDQTSSTCAPTAKRQNSMGTVITIDPNAHVSSTIDYLIERQNSNEAVNHDHPLSLAKENNQSIQIAVPSTYEGRTHGETQIKCRKATRRSAQIFEEHDADRDITKPMEMQNVQRKHSSRDKINNPKEYEVTKLIRDNIRAGKISNVIQLLKNRDLTILNDHINIRLQNTNSVVCVTLFQLAIITKQTEFVKWLLQEINDRSQGVRGQMHLLQQILTSRVFIGSDDCLCVADDVCVDGWTTIHVAAKFDPLSLEEINWIILDKSDADLYELLIGIVLEDQNNCLKHTPCMWLFKIRILLQPGMSFSILFYMLHCNFLI